MVKRGFFVLLIASLFFLFSALAVSNVTFQMKFIEQGTTDAGADGTHLTDINGDGCQDIVTGWEQSGYARVYLANKTGTCNGNFTVLNVSNSNGYTKIEDAHFVDLNNDSIYDVAIAREVGGREITVFWGLNTTPLTWQDGQNITNVSGQANWMKLAHADMDNDGDIDLVACSKQGSSAPYTEVRLLHNPGGNSTQQMNVSAWRSTTIAPASFCMSLILDDFNGDGWIDMMYSDRNRGLEWRQNPNSSTSAFNTTWSSKRITNLNNPGGQLRFCDYYDFDGDGFRDPVCANGNNTNAKPHVVTWWKNPGNTTSAETQSNWLIRNITLNNTLTNLDVTWTKMAGTGDLDGDGWPDLAIVQADVADGNLTYWIKSPGNQSVTANIALNWTATLINYTAGAKYDEVQVYDIDGDGDNDILTSEEHFYGVLWFRNDFDDDGPTVTINSPTNTTYTSLPLLFNVTLGENGTVNYSLDSGTTNLSMSSTDNVNFNASNSSIANGNYTLFVYAMDIYNNTNYTQNVSFTILVTASESSTSESSSSSSSSSGGSDPDWYSTANAGEVGGTQTNLSLRKKFRAKLTIDNRIIYLGVLDIKEHYADLQLYTGITQQFKLIPGQSKKLDTDADGYYDLLVNLREIDSLTAKLSTVRIYEEINPQKAQESTSIIEEKLDELASGLTSGVMGYVAAGLIIALFVFLIIRHFVHRHRLPHHKHYRHK